MRLTFKPFDGRTPDIIPIIDEETGKEAGSITATGTGDLSVGIVVSILDGRYKATLNRRDECRGFVKGVEVVLNEVACLLK
jgi:hypothetical protein